MWCGRAVTDASDRLRYPADAVALALIMRANRRCGLSNHSRPTSATAKFSECGGKMIRQSPHTRGISQVFMQDDPRL